MSLLKLEIIVEEGTLPVEAMLVIKEDDEFTPIHSAVTLPSGVPRDFYITEEELESLSGDSSRVFLYASTLTDDAVPSPFADQEVYYQIPILHEMQINFPL